MLWVRHLSQKSLSASSAHAEMLKRLHWVDKCANLLLPKPSITCHGGICRTEQPETRFEDHIDAVADSQAALWVGQLVYSWHTKNVRETRKEEEKVLGSAWERDRIHLCLCSSTKQLLVPTGALRWVLYITQASSYLWGKVCAEKSSYLGARSVNEWMLWQV